MAKHGGGRVQPMECPDLRRARMWQRGAHVLHAREPHRGVHVPEMRGEGSEEIIGFATPSLDARSLRGAPKLGRSLSTSRATFTSPSGVRRVDGVEAAPTPRTRPP